MELKKKSLLWVLSLCFFGAVAQQKTTYKPLKLGYSIGLNKINKEELQNAKKAGIDYIEIGGWNALLDKQTRAFILSDEDLKKKIDEVKLIADEAGIKIWSLHMPYGKDEDISIADEVARKRTLSTHEKIIKYAAVLKPQIILFHPSWYLGLNERELRKDQLIKSALELNKKVEKINAKMVVENMLGPQLLKSPQQERPLCRSVDEVTEIMGRLPKNIYAAVDMNHIKNPEKLIDALGNRLKSVHIADGDGLAERHYFPCSGKGKNDWNAIFSALYGAGYDGAFIYESAYPSLEAMKPCYETMYTNFLSNIKEK
ncbi:fructoselysine 3-epimerase [compost metagenome]